MDFLELKIVMLLGSKIHFLKRRACYLAIAS